MITISKKFDHFQSSRILPIARALFVVAALASLLVIVGAFVWVVVLQVQIWTPTHQTPVPELPPQPTVEHSALDVDAVARRLVPPSEISAKPYGSLTSATEAGMTVAKIDAATANGLAPDGLLVLGGGDAAFFRAVRIGDGLGLAATQELIDAVKPELETLSEPRMLEFRLRLAVRDRYGLTSSPQEVSLELSLRPAGQVSATAPSSAEQVEQLNAWHLLARDIALAIDPQRSTDYFEAYQRALQVPQQCGAVSQIETFAAEARPAFELVSNKLASANPEAFYDGLCSAWDAARNKERAERARTESALREAAEMRQAVIASNERARAAAAGETIRVRALQFTSLAVIGAALVAFLFVSLLLAFLAIEGHSKAIRSAMEAISRNETRGQTPYE